MTTNANQTTPKSKISKVATTSTASAVALQARNVSEEWRRFLKRAHSSRNTATVAMRNVINVHIQGHDSVA